VRHWIARNARYRGIKLLPAKWRSNKARRVKEDVAVEHHQVSLHLVGIVRSLGTGMRPATLLPDPLGVVLVPCV
jgi:hypothetical protein